MVKLVQYFLLLLCLAGLSYQLVAQNSVTNTTTASVHDQGNEYVNTLQNDNCIEAEISPENPGAICEMQPVTLYANTIAQANYQWLRDGQQISGATASSLEVGTAGAYRVVISNSTCSDTSAVVTITEEDSDKPNQPTIEGPSVVCEGEHVQFSTPTVQDAEYYWTGPDEFVSTVQNPLIENVGAANAGVYSLEVRLGRCHSTAASFSLEVTTPVAPGITYSGDSILCQEDSIFLNASHPTASSYQWQKDGKPIAGATAKILTVKQAGAYRVTIHTNTDCAKTSQPVTIVNYRLNATFTAHEQVCTEEIVQFTNLSEADSSLAVSYLWDFGDGQTSSEANPSHSYSEPGYQQVTLSISGPQGSCMDEIAREIEVIALPKVSLTPAAAVTICKGDTLTAFVTGAYQNLSWQHGSTDSTLQITKAGTYQVTAYNELGCSVTRELTVTESTSPTLEIYTNRTQIVAGEALELTASGATYYEWYQGTKLIADQSTVSITPDSSTTYILTGYTSDGCASSDSITIHVDQKAFMVNASNLFSPNNDGIDDYWKVEGISHHTDCQLKIFNIQGNLVYQSDNYYANDWSGTDQQGTPLPEGVYYFTLQCGNSSDQQSGSITLLR